MRKRGILNVQLSSYISALGHKDLFLIGDAGMPIPKGVPIVDLVLCGGIPTFLQTLEAILDEAEVEHYTVATEMTDGNPALLNTVHELLPGVDNTMISHEDLKKLSKDVKFAVRTGEFSPYANIILRAGVVFH